MIHNALSPGLRAALSAHNTPLGVPPVFLADFAGTGSLIPTKGSGLSITRTGGATRVGPTGLVEFAPENLHGHADFTSAHWPKTRASVVAAGESMPGVYAAYPASKLIASSDPSNSHRVDDAVVLPSPNTAYTFSVVAKASEYNGVALSCNWASPVNNSAVFDLRDGSTDIIGGEAVASGSEDLGGGWYRCWATFNVGVLAYDRVHISVADPDAGPTITDKVHFTGNDSDGILIGCPMISRGSTLHDFVATSGSPYYSPRIDYDPATLECLGYLHETQSTNLLTTSNPTEWSDTGMVATAAGTILGQPARALVPTAVNESHRVFAPGATTTSGSTYTRSFYVKSDDFQYFRIREGAISGRVASFDLIAGTCSATSGATAIMQDCGNGVFRCSYVDTHNGTTSAIQIGFDNGEVNNPLTAWTGDGVSVGYVAMAQTEKQGRASSYIPTYGDIITRTQDSARVASADFINADEGTLFGDFVPVGNAAEVGRPQGFIGIDSSNRAYGSLAFGNSSFANLSLAYVTGPAAWEGFLTSTVAMPADRVKVALTYQHDKPTVDDFAAQAALNGVASALDTVGQRPVNALSQLVIGANGFTSGPQTCSAHFRTVSYYKKRLSESQLESLTAL